jgi:hypothetical protein
MPLPRTTTTAPLLLAGFDQLQHLGPEATGATFAIERLEDCLGCLLNVAGLGTEPGPLEKLGGMGEKALAIRTFGCTGVGTPDGGPRTTGDRRRNRQGPRASDGLHV